uniref:DAHP synthase n=1 Tax=Streptoalloteichus sp. ATCC 53650 TaxID=756733 RepID=K4NYQ3_9PSEU|nr:DAHP synthase [Streptoalloteichus sp. ATCC 53650]
MLLIVLKDSTTDDQRDEVRAHLHREGLQVRTHGPTVLSADSTDPAFAETVRGLAPVARATALPAPYFRAARQATGADSVVAAGSLLLGGGDFAVIAGPCAVESRDQLLLTARAVAGLGAHALRGGAYKPRTSPYSFQGLGRDGLELLSLARAETNLPVVSEITDIRELDAVVEHVDVIQIGARNMQNYAMLRAVGATGVPVLLKRGLGATITETLLAAEYVLDAGTPDVVLCERGIRTFETSYRFTLDLGAVSVLKERTHLPVIVDPSHAAGATEHVIPLALAAAAVGADGIIVETHHDPAAALCDGKQALSIDDFAALMDRLGLAVAAAGRNLAPTAAPVGLASSV